MKVFVETERFILREMLQTDIGGMFELDSDPEVHKYLGNSPVKDRQQIVDTIDFVRKQYIEHGIGRWAVVDKESNDFIGWAGLKFVSNEINGHSHFYDLGYRFMKRYWGRGIATETALASLTYAFDKLKLTTVYAMADFENVGSHRVLQKVGLNFIETFNYDGVIHNWYRIDKMLITNESL